MTESPLRRAVGPTLVASLLVLSLGSLTAAGLALGAPAPHVLPHAGVDFVNISATMNYAFTPAQFSVLPGDTVHLAVTQLANFNHTFTLSPVANYTFPSSSSPSDIYTFFHAHAAIVNLSLGSTVNVVTTATFTAPPAGSYEFLCVISGHFQSGMHGEMTSGSASSGGGSGASNVTLYVVVGVIVVVAIVAVAFVVRGRRAKTPPPPSGGTAPPASP